MFLKKFVQFFSKPHHHHHLIIPYYPKGYKHPPFDLDAKRVITKHYKIEEDGFIYAFNNLISSINHDDFFEFADKICDPKLVQGFREGLEQLQDDDRQIEVVFDQDVEEEVSFARNPNALIGIDQDQSYYAQKALLDFNVGKMNVEIYDTPGFQIPLLSMTVSCYIKCATTLKISGQDSYPYSYHFVEFQLIKDPTTQVTPNLSMLFKEDANDLIMGKDSQWRIINIDNFLRKPK